MPTKLKLKLKTLSSQPARRLESISVKKFVDDYAYRIDMDADYQREKIWSRQNQESLIDSILKNIDIPKIYLARVKGSENFDYECVDGKQRMVTLLSFFKPDAGDEPLTVQMEGQTYSYARLQRELPDFAHRIEDFELTFVIYEPLGNEEFVREIFRRLQLGVRLNAGELLKTYTGTIRDFVYTEMGNEAPFLRRTKLSEKRFSRQFTMGQICINSMSRAKTGTFVRARYDDLGEFFKEYYNLDHKSRDLVRIRRVLKLMESGFGDKAAHITSRAVAVSAYLFVETLFQKKRHNQIAMFAEFLQKLLSEIKENLTLLARFQAPKNEVILDHFQRYVSHASVEPFAIKGRDHFLQLAFKHYINHKKILTRWVSE